jgi:hypothetical protein
MSEFDKLALAQACSILKSHFGVKVIGDWVPINEIKVTFMLSLELQIVDAEPTMEIPEFSSWNIIVDFEDDKWGKVQLFPSLDNNAVKATFQHQLYNGGTHPTWPVRNGHICTLENTHGLAISKNALKIEPKYTVERITWHVDRAIEWLTAAASYSLVKNGDYFELPDFDVINTSKSIALAYYENVESYEHWNNISERAGLAYISIFNNTVITKRYLDKKDEKILYEPSWGSLIKKLPEKRALWLRLNKTPVINVWQVPSTMEELISVLKLQGIDLPEIVRMLMPKFNDPSECLLILGMPIPQIIGETCDRYHWQAMVLSPVSKKIKSNFVRTQMTINHLQSRQPLPWLVSSENWHPDELQNRGRLCKSLLTAKILLIGGGALGAIISEQIVRMGICDLTVVDKDIFEPGNLVRHALDIDSIRHHKSQALAEDLNKLNPSANVKGLILSAPNDSDEFKNAATHASLILDLTADDGLMDEFPLKEFHPDSIIISCSLGLHANRVFLFADLAKNFNVASFNSWFQPYRDEEHKLAEKEALPRGIGCWHPIVPAPFNRICGLASVVLEFIQQIYNDETILPVSYCHEWCVPNLKSGITKAA